jgi:high-affinity iron transporter
MKSTIEGEIDLALSTGQKRGIAMLTFIAVFREGVETALFLSAAAFSTNEMDTLLGGVVGLVFAVLIGYLLFASTITLNLKKFFDVTSALLLLFAAGLFAHGIHEFQEAGLIAIIKEHLWDINHILDEKSTVGEMLKALLGYNGNPSLLEVIAYIAYWVFALFGIRALVNYKIDRMPETTATA